MPDEIYVAIDLRERGSGNSKDTVDKQELDLKEAVNGLDIDATDLTLSDATADLVPNKFRDDDVIARKRYMLKVADAGVVRMVFLGSDHLQIKDVGIHHVPRSKEVELRREQRIKAAKEKANYLLEAIGERTGPALKVEETQGIQQLPVVQARQQYNNARLLGGNEAMSDYEEMGVSFSRFTISASVQVKSGIAAKPLRRNKAAGFTERPPPINSTRYVPGAASSETCRREVFHGIRSTVRPVASMVTSCRHHKFLLASTVKWPSQGEEAASNAAVMFASRVLVEKPPNTLAIGFLSTPS